MRKIEKLIIFLIIILILGGVRIRQAMGASNLINRINRDLIIRAEIKHIKYIDPDESKYVVRVRGLKDGDESLDIKEDLMLKIIGGQKFDLGDELIFKASLREPMRNTNPKLYNYKLNLLSNKIYTSTTIRDHAVLGLRKNSSLTYRLRIDFRDRVEESFNKYLSKDKSSLMKSIVLGDYSYMEEEDLAVFRDLGLAHILAVSGLHIGIISGFLILFLSHLGFKRKYTSLFTLASIWIYGYLIGFPPSLLRANIMLTIYLIGFLLAEYYDGLNALALAFLISFIINPMTVFNLSFQLSFVATFSIIYLSPKIRNYLYFLGPKTSAAISGLVAVQLGLLPLQAYYFNRISFLAIISNLVLGPIFSLALILAMLIIFLSYSLGFLNILVANILNIVLSIQFLLVRLIHGLGLGLIRIHSLASYEFIYYYLTLAILFKIIELRDFEFKIKKTVFYFLTFTLMLNTLYLIGDKSMEIHFIDVGQGDSIYIKSKEGNYLIDTGGNVLDGFDIGENITLPYLEKHGVTSLDAVFLTHLHDDHAKALPLIMDRIKVKNILIGREDFTSPIFMEILNKGGKPRLVREGDRIKLNKYTSIDILGPSSSHIEENLSDNNLSLVFVLNYFDTKILFTGDIEKEMEYELLGKLTKVHIVKVPHHGSISSSTEEFLDIIRPDIGIIPVGRNNFHNHPHREVLKRYESINTNIYRTDQHGRIKIILDGDRIEVIPFIKEG